MELTNGEKALILKRRAEDQAKQIRKKNILRALVVAADYEQWLQTHGRGSSLSTFVDEFRCEDKEPSNLFSRVESIRRAAAEVTPLPELNRV